MVAHTLTACLLEADNHSSTGDALAAAKDVLAALLATALTQFRPQKGGSITFMNHARVMCFP